MTRAVVRRALSLGMMALLVLPSSAVAHDHRIPDATLQSSGGEQEGVSYTATWAGDQGEFCWALHADGFRGFPEPIRFMPGETLRLHLYKEQRPHRVRVTAYRAVNPINQSPIDPGEKVPVTLEPRRERGKITGWDAVFTAPLGADIYLDVTALWRDRQGCGLMQGVSWAFHVRVV